MRLFVTGATGWIGSAVVPELIGAGHEVVGLARSDASAAALEAAGAEARPGTLDDLDALTAAAAASDGVIHLAYRHDLVFTGDFAGSVAADRRAIDALGAGLTGTGRPLVIANGFPLAAGRTITERDALTPENAGPRAGSEQALLALAPSGVRAVSVRLGRSVHGAGDPGFVAALVDVARERRVAGYVGDGANRWPAVHRSDAARLFRLAAESAPAGSVVHAVAEEGVPMRAIAEAIGEQLGVPPPPSSPSTSAGWARSPRPTAPPRAR